jgi:hypothetical protein
MAKEAGVQKQRRNSITGRRRTPELDSSSKRERTSKSRNRLSKGSVCQCWQEWWRCLILRSEPPTALDPSQPTTVQIVSMPLSGQRPCTWVENELVDIQSIANDNPRNRQSHRYRCAELWLSCLPQCCLDRVPV